MSEHLEVSVRFQRANYLVTDMDEALRMYRDVLGLSVEFTKDSPDDSYSYPVFEIPNSAKLRFAVLSTPDQPRVMALTEVKGVAIEPVPHPRRAAIVLDIADIDGVVSRAKTGGFKVYPEEKLETHDGRVGREIGIVDADENLVVIYHITGRAD